MTDLSPASRYWRNAYAAAAWACLFAAISLYWAAGGRAGAATIGVWAVEAAATREPSVVLALWASALGKALLGLLPLALARDWFPFIPRRLLRLATAVLGALIALYYLANLVQHLLMLAGAIPIARSLGRSGLLGHLLFWDPWWILGGALFLLAARRPR